MCIHIQLCTEIFRVFVLVCQNFNGPIEMAVHLDQPSMLLRVSITDSDVVHRNINHAS